eukprot:314445-Pleurochrysis_carterae.AAC.1
MASGPLGCSGAISTPASRDRSSLIADTYPDTVPARSTDPCRAVCLEPPRLMCSARSARVSWLYCAPPGLAGSTNGTLSVPSVNDSNHPSAVIVRLGSVASSMRALLAVRSSCRRVLAASEGSPLRHWSGSLGPRGPVSPAASARSASDHAARRRSAPGSSCAAPGGTIGAPDLAGAAARSAGGSVPCAAPLAGVPSSCRSASNGPSLAPVASSAGGPAS